jgi:surface antigen
MAKLTDKEIIARIEQAPVEVQTMVAKAFIRADIDNEDVQYLFNTDSLEQLNDAAEESAVENVDAPAPEGIGAGEFFIRNSKPSGNKNFMTTGSGGWNTCIKGYPNDPNANVLANCVGYASGRFNEIINEARGTTGCTYKYLNCNAENFIERAQAAGLKTGSTPRVGAIGCAMKGSTLNGGDGAGHVWIVEKVNSASSTYTSESGYGSTAFWNQTRNNSNGRWGLSAGYTFRAYIYLPDDVQKVVDGKVNPPAPTPTPGPSSKFNIGDKVVINGPLYVNSNAASPSGSVSNKVTEITRKAVGAAHPYNTSGDLGWMDESSISAYVAPAPAPTPAPTPAPAPRPYQ